MNTNEKLLRPLHRQRIRRRARVEVVGLVELADRFGVAKNEVEAHLIDRGIAFHKDSNGGIWCSVPLEN